MANFQCKVVTPANAVFDGDATYVSIPAWDGQQGIMHGQSPLLTRLGIGTLRIDRSDGGSVHYMVDGGFAQAQGDVLTILTERAMLPGDIDTESASQELRDANRAVLEGGPSHEQAVLAQERARAKMAVSDNG